MNGSESSQGVDKLDRNNCKWQRYEISTLLHRLAGGAAIELIAPDMHRTIDGCKNELKRLLFNPENCPVEARDALEIIRKMREAKEAGKNEIRSRRRRVPVPMSSDEMKAQYLELRKSQADITELLKASIRVQKIILAGMIAQGELAIEDLLDHGLFDLNDIHDVERLVKIFEARQGMTDGSTPPTTGKETNLPDPELEPTGAATADLGSGTAPSMPITTGESTYLGEAER